MLAPLMSDQQGRALAFRALHDSPDTFVIPNPWDAGTARLLAEIGYSALATTSAGLAFSLGRPNGHGAVTREETLANARSIVEATTLPVSADLENGFGDSPEMVAETIRRAASVGLVGGSIEDATGDPAGPIYCLEHAVARVAAGVEAARSLPFPFMLTARAENFLHGRPDLDDTIKRLKAFEAVGADVLFAPGLPDLDAIRTVCAAVSRPVNVLAGSRVTIAELGHAGVRRISVGSSPARVALGAFMRAAREIKDTGTFTCFDQAPTYSELNAMFTRPVAGTA